VNPPNNVQIAAVRPTFPKATKQECDDLARKIANLRQELRNRAFKIEMDEAPGLPLAGSVMGHVTLYIKSQAALTFRIAQYNGGGCNENGPTPPVAPAPRYRLQQIIKSRIGCCLLEVRVL